MTDCKHTYHKMYPDKPCEVCRFEQLQLDDDKIKAIADTFSIEYATQIKKNQEYAKYYIDFMECRSCMVTQDQLQMIDRIQSQLYQVFWDWWHKPCEENYSETISKLLIEHLYLIKTGKKIEPKYFQGSMEDLSMRVLDPCTDFHKLWGWRK